MHNCGVFMVHPSPQICLSYSSFSSEMHIHSQNVYFFLWVKMLISSLLPLGFQEWYNILQLCDYCTE